MNPLDAARGAVRAVLSAVAGDDLTSSAHATRQAGIHAARKLAEQKFERSHRELRDAIQAAHEARDQEAAAAVARAESARREHAAAFVSDFAQAVDAPVAQFITGESLRKSGTAIAAAVAKFDERAQVELGHPLQADLLAASFFRAMGKPDVIGDPQWFSGAASSARNVVAYAVVALAKGASGAEAQRILEGVEAALEQHARESRYPHAARAQVIASSASPGDVSSALDVIVRADEKQRHRAAIEEASRGDVEEAGQ